MKPAITNKAFTSRKIIIWKLGPVAESIDAIAELEPLAPDRMRHRAGHKPVVAQLVGYGWHELQDIGQTLHRRYPGIYSKMRYLISQGPDGVHGAAIFPLFCNYDRAHAVMADVLV